MLIVDDMQINRIVLASLLATRGIVSDQAESGSECIALCENNDYDLILLDHRMPELDGVDTFIRLKEMFSERGRDVPVICHTTEEGRNNINLYKAVGFADVLIKPIDPRELYETIMNHLGGKDPAASENESLSDPLLSSENMEEDDADAISGFDVKKELEMLPAWLKLVPHIDLSAGLYNCGSAEDYLDALYVFYSSIEEKSDELESFLEHEDYTMYSLRIHSLKSMLRIIGVKKLGKMAASLESAAKEGRFDFIRDETADFLGAFRDFKKPLSPILKEEALNHAENSCEISQSNAAQYRDPYHCPNVLYIQSGEGIVKKGIEKNLSGANFKVITVPDEPDRIIASRNDAEIIIYNPGTNDGSNVGITMNILSEICQDDSKILCLTGDMSEINRAMASNGAGLVSRIYPRPVDVDALVKDVTFFKELLDEYHRRKTIFVVDDDTGYLSVIERWLSPAYSVQCFNSGKKMLDGLSAITADLILCDLEMPQMDGIDLMRILRLDNENREQKIPIILLTGNNNKEIVFNALKYKPDGYLLKTSPKEYILDVIHRFFKESMFKRSQ